MEEMVFLHQLKSGDKTAFAKLVAIHQRNVINICYRFLLNQEDAEDIAQEVFIEVFHSLKNFKGQSKLGTWIYRIAVSKSLDEIKKQNRKKRISSAGKILGLEQISDWLAGGTRPDKILEAQESLDILFENLNKIPDNQRIALTLSKIDGYSNPEIAELMQTTVIAVESLIYRAKKQLSEQYKS